MTVQLEIGMIISLLLTLLGALVGGGKLLLAQIDRRQSERDAKQEELIHQLQGKIDGQSAKIHDLEMSFMKLQADLPVIYTLRADYLNNFNKIEARLESISSKIEEIFKAQK